MKQISTWARHHKWPARFLIIILYALLNGLALLLGMLVEPQLPLFVLYLLLIPFLAAVLLYPLRRNKGRYAHFFRARKTADLVLATLSFLMMVCFANRQELPPTLFPSFAAAAVLPGEEPPVQKKFTIHFAQKNFIARQWKKIKTGVREIRAALKRPGGAGKAALIVLTLLVSIGLLLLVAGLSCDLSCSGSEGLALTVALLGTGLVVFLAVVVIRRIQHGPKPRPQLIKD